MDAPGKRVQDRTHDSFRLRSSRNQSITEVFHERIKEHQPPQSPGIHCNPVWRDGYHHAAPRLWPAGSRSDLVQPVGRTDHGSSALRSATSGRASASADSQVCVVGSSRRQGSRKAARSPSKAVLKLLTRRTPVRADAPGLAVFGTWAPGIIPHKRDLELNCFRVARDTLRTREFSAVRSDDGAIPALGSQSVVVDVRIPAAISHINR